MKLSGRDLSNFNLIFTVLPIKFTSVLKDQGHSHIFKLKVSIKKIYEILSHKRPNASGLFLYTKTTYFEVICLVRIENVKTLLYFYLKAHCTILETSFPKLHFKPEEFENYGIALASQCSWMQKW